MIYPSPRICSWPVGDGSGSWPGWRLLSVRAGVLVLAMTAGFLAMDQIGPYLPMMQMRMDVLEGGEIPMSLGFAVLLTAFAPVGRLLTTAFPGRWAKLLVGNGTLVFLLGFSLLRHCQAWIAEIAFVHVLVAHLLSWSACAYGMYRIMMGRDLVRR